MADDFVRFLHSERVGTLFASNSGMADDLPAPEVAAFSEPGSQPKLLDRVRNTVRARHYSRRTENTYVHWIRRFIIFHHKKHPSTIGAPEIAAFLSWLATTRRVSSSTQNQALSALLFLYRHVLRIEIGAIEQVPRAKMPHRLPVVLSIEEVGNILAHVQGTVWIIVALLYGAGLRLQECLIVQAHRGADRYDRIQRSLQAGSCDRRHAAHRVWGL